MGYDGKINRKLSQIEIDKENWKIFPDVIEYKLAYGKTKHKYFENKEILNYIDENYLKNDDIIEENLLNDLITFKTYKTDREVLIRHFDVIQNGISAFLSLLAVIMSFSAACLSSKFISKYVIRQDFTIWIVKYIFAVFMVFSLMFLIFVLARVGKNSASYDLKFIDNAIYTLETIKEDMDKTENLRAKYKSTRNRYSPMAMHYRKRR
ncbi:MAG: hypothetical protein E6105_08485 [Finegoldia magna]|nr:hypothetical protein [Finegoldia magna]